MYKMKNTKYIDMDKKSYICPQVLIVTLRTCGVLLDGSPAFDIVNDPDDPPFNPDEEGIQFSREDNQSSNNVWDNAW